MNKSIYLKILSVIFFFSFKNSACAQLKDRYEKGSIELQNGQTIKGYINDDELAKMNYSIRYKESEGEKNTSIYDTSQIKTFQLDNGKIFELLSFQENDMTNHVSALAKLIIKGKTSLYKLVYNSTEIYIITND